MIEAWRFMLEHNRYSSKEAWSCSNRNSTFRWGILPMSRCRGEPKEGASRGGINDGAEVESLVEA